jgi:hypothetical protein
VMPDKHKGQLLGSNDGSKHETYRKGTMKCKLPPFQVFK